MRCPVAAGRWICWWMLWSSRPRETFRCGGFLRRYLRRYSPRSTVGCSIVQEYACVSLPSSCQESLLQQQWRTASETRPGCCGSVGASFSPPIWGGWAAEVLQRRPSLCLGRAVALQVSVGEGAPLLEKFVVHEVEVDGGLATRSKIEGLGACGTRIWHRRAPMHRCHRRSLMRDVALRSESRPPAQAACRLLRGPRIPVPSHEKPPPARILVEFRAVRCRVRPFVRATPFLNSGAVLPTPVLDLMRVLQG